MARIEIGNCLVSDARVCDGRLIFKKTRILVYDALELAQKGYSAEAIAKQYRGLIKASAIREALSLVRKGLVREVGAKKAVA